MAYEHYDINDIKGSDEPKLSLTQRMLLSMFPRSAAQAIYGLGVDIVAFIAKLGLILILPLKFIQFWIESYKKLKKK